MSEEKRPTARAPRGEIAVALIDSAMFTSMPATLIKIEEIKASVSAETPLIVLINLAPPVKQERASARAAREELIKGWRNLLERVQNPKRLGGKRWPEAYFCDEGVVILSVRGEDAASCSIGAVSVCGPPGACGFARCTFWFSKP